MLKTVINSSAMKTTFCSITYRAGRGDNFGTCPASCNLNPSGCGAAGVDTDYLNTLLDAVPAGGVSFTYSHFNFLNYAHLLKLGRTVINYSADSIKAALNAFKILPTVINVNADFWQGKKTQVIEGVKIVKCPAEADKKLNCRSCGAGRPLCARLDRDYIIGFTDHGTFKKKASDSNTRGGCYATGGHVALHWAATSKADQLESDSQVLKRFTKTLPWGQVLRHHIAGDIGKELL